MNSGLPDELSNRSMLELFLAEAESQSAVLMAGLLELERNPASPGVFANLMRAAHSLKGAARIVNLQLAVSVAHALEDCVVAAQQRGVGLQQAQIDALFCGADLLANLAKRTETTLPAWESDNRASIAEFLRSAGHLSTAACAPQTAAPALAHGSPLRTEALERCHVSQASPEVARQPSRQPSSPGSTQNDGPSLPLTIHKTEAPERVVRLAADNLNRLLGLASESLVESRWLQPFAQSLQRLRRQHLALCQQLEAMRHSLGEQAWAARSREPLDALCQQAGQAQQLLAERLEELDQFDRRSAELSQRLYLEALRTRMRPFNDGVRRFPRMVRDLARALGKVVRLEITGENTQVDRDILERLESPLAHLLRNAVDHGCESPEQRQRVGKPIECALRLEAHHSAGVLVVSVCDDGAGVDLDRLRLAIVNRGLASQASANKLTEQELLEFLFVPGFTLKETVTEISGRGFGLDVAQNMAKSVRGSIRLANQRGHGLRVQLQLPLTLSVLRALLVEVAAEPYAIPLSQIHRTLRVPQSAIENLDGQPHVRLSDQTVALLAANQVLECGQHNLSGQEVSVVIVGERNRRYGLAVDRFLGERELVVQPLDPRLGKVGDISAAALMEDGAPVLIIDVEEMLHSVEKQMMEGRLAHLDHQTFCLPPPAQKRVLAVDDSLTVRELERQLLSNHGYQVDVAADGVEAWNALCGGKYDLVITDMDMPRMNGIELAARIKNGSHLQSVAVLMLSYKDAEEERSRGLQAGADCYLAKGTFHDQALLRAVTELIGGPDA